MLDWIAGILSTALLAVFGWAFHINTKVNVLDQQHKDFKGYLAELLDAKFDLVHQRLDRIDRSLNGKLRE